MPADRDADLDSNGTPPPGSEADSYTPRPGPGRPRMNREDYEDAIERTPEYEAFMAELEEFHRKQGTTLQREPVLGGKKLDIMRIYKWVMEAGGYEKVTQDRGWKKISIPFNLPSTCTNSAFVVKQAYHRNLLAYEHYKTGKTIPVGLFGSPRRDASFESSPMSPAMSALAAINTLASPARKAEPASIKLQKRTDVPSVLGRSGGQNSATPQFQLQPHPVPSVRSHLPNPDDVNDEKYLAGGPQNRLLLALESGLPNEIDWAFNKLVKLSYLCPNNFHIGSIPNLVDVLLSFAAPFFVTLVLNSKADGLETTQKEDAEWTLALPLTSSISMFLTKETMDVVERVMQVLHVLRNLSMLEQNAKFLAQHASVITMIAKCTALPSHSVFIEMKIHCLDIFENLAFHIKLRGKRDFYLNCLMRLVFENDSALILGSLRCLIRLSLTEANEPILADIDPSLIERLLDLLLLKDEEMVLMVLEYFYQYSSISVEAATMIAEYSPPTHLIKMLTSLIHWKNFAVPPPGLPNPGAILAARPAIPTFSPMPVFSGQPGMKRPLSSRMSSSVITQSPAPIPSFTTGTSSASGYHSVLTMNADGSLTSSATAGRGRPRKNPLPGAVTPMKRKGEDDEEDGSSGSEGDGEYQPEVKRSKPNVRGPILASVSQVGLPVPSAVSSPSEPAGTGIAASTSVVPTINLPHRITSGPDPPSIPESLKYACWWNCDPLSPPPPQIVKNVAKQDTIDPVGDDPMEGLSEGPNPEEPRDPAAKCHLVFDNEIDLYQHIIAAHFPPTPTFPNHYTCRWKFCTRFEPTEALSRARAFAHFQTHFPLFAGGRARVNLDGSTVEEESAPVPVVGKKGKVLNTSMQPAVPAFPFPPGVDMSQDLQGVPLSTLLVLKNMAKAPKLRGYFVPYEHMLAQVAADPRTAGMVVQILGELVE